MASRRARRRPRGSGWPWVLRGWMLQGEERKPPSVRRARRVYALPLSGITKRVTRPRADGQDAKGREALLKYVLRPPMAQERVTLGPDGRVSPFGDHEARRIVLKKPFSDGTVAVDLDPLSLLSRLAASVPSPRRHTVRYDPWTGPEEGRGGAGVGERVPASRPRARPPSPRASWAGQGGAKRAMEARAITSAPSDTAP